MKRLKYKANTKPIRVNLKDIPDGFNKPSKELIKELDSLRRWRARSKQSNSIINQ